MALPIVHWREDGTPTSPRFIRTERGLGYVFDGDVEVFRARD